MQDITKEFDKSIVTVLTYDARGITLDRAYGFFVSKDGDVITNRHIFLNSDRAEIKTSQGKIYPVTGIVAEDTKINIVRISTNAPTEEIKPLPLNRKTPKIGESVAVIGTPTVSGQTFAIVSDVISTLRFGNVFQITAPIFKSSSGYPVVNKKGEVIGITAFQLVVRENLDIVFPSERIDKLNPKEPKSIAEWKSEQTKDWLNSADGLYYTGFLYFLLNEYEKALRYLEKVAREKPDYADLYFYIGYCKDELGRYSQAIEAYKQAILLKPDFFEAYSNLGAIYADIGRYTEAIEVLNLALQLNPRDAQVYYNLGLVYGSLGRYEDEIKAYEKAITYEPDHLEALLSLCEAYLKLGRYKDAVKIHKIGIRFFPDLFEFYLGLGIVYVQLGKYKDAIEPVKRAIELNPKFLEHTSPSA
jgi:Flp pilus assembly protein TadD